MKRLKIHIVLLIGALTTSCDALELGAEDQYSINNYWKTTEQCERFITGLHVRLRGQMADFLLMGEMRGGLLETGSITSVGQGAYYVPVISNSLSLANPGLTSWGGFYADIYQINHAIDKISNGCSFLSATQRNTFLGQLYGIRAYYYFHLLRTWGGVPLCDKPDILSTDDMTKLDKPRSTEQEIWQFVRDDVDRSAAAYAELGFDDYKNKNCYWNKGATICLQAEVYLWGAKVKPLKGSAVFSPTPEQDLRDARTALLEAKAHYSANSNFADAFSTKNKDTNKEIVMALRYKIGEAENTFSNFTYPAATFTGYTDAAGNPLNDPINVGGGALRNEWRFEFFDDIDDKDTRKRATFYPFYKKQNDEIVPVGIFLYKFIGELDNSNNRKYTNDWPLYRYMDIVLMLAEISNELDVPADVKTYIEEVRTRAYGQANMPAFTYTGKTEAEKAILAERDIEFVAEGKRWYDIRRMLGGEKALELVDELKLVWPIDAGVLSSDSKVKQNEGYL